MFRQIVGHLHELLPAPLPVDVHLGWPGERRYGVYGLERTQFDICVSSWLPQGHSAVLFNIISRIRKAEHAARLRKQKGRRR